MRRKQLPRRPSIPGANMSTERGAKTDPLTGNRPIPPAYIPEPVDPSSASLFKTPKVKKFFKIKKFIKGS